MPGAIIRRETLMELPGGGKSTFGRQTSAGSTAASSSQDRCSSWGSDAESVGSDGEEISSWLDRGACCEDYLIAVARDGTARFVDHSASAMQDRCGSRGSDAESVGSDEEEISGWLDRGACPEDCLIAVARNGMARFVDRSSQGSDAGSVWSDEDEISGWL